MRIDKKIADARTLSFEVFPPKPEADDDLSGIKRTIAELSSSSPDFVSVTFGAGGNNRPRALDIAKIVTSHGMVPLSHITAAGYTREDASRLLGLLRDLGVENILALRGDVPKDVSEETCWRDYRRASELSAHVSEFGAFCIGGAAYPEGHQHSVSTEMDIRFMKEKVESGVSFFITQLFFDNDAFFRFAERVAGVLDTPVIAGIMPVFRASQITRVIEISGCRAPEKLSSLLDKYMDDDDSMREAGIDYAVEQINGLWSAGTRGVHIYTMNRSREILEILKRCDLPGRGESVQR
ncbi:MAG: methylenetetrahydrofolate reductase [Synergistaceae bacterium]|nr:methylenetetrahydrofolate reductase [Synergistaceae bacterium]